MEKIKVIGVKTTLPFGKFVMNNSQFKSGNFDTHFVKNFFKSDELNSHQKDEAEVAALLSKYLIESETKANLIVNTNHSSVSKWKKNR